MAQPSIPMVCGGVVEVLAGIQGVKPEFPKPERITQSPSVVVLWGSPSRPTTIDHSAGMQDWLAYVTLLILVDHRDVTPTEVALIYRLVTEITDAFAIGDYGEVPTPMDGLCNHCQVVEANPEWETPFGGSLCYGAMLTLEIGMTRTPGLE